MSKKLISILFVLILASALVLSACGGNNQNNNENPVDANPVAEDPAVEDPAVEDPVVEDPVVVEPVENRGVLKFDTGLAYGGLENLDSVDPNRDWPAIALLFDRLVEPAFDSLTPSPSLATSWESNTAGDAWTFYLREDVFFHDGTQLTSADVLYSADHWQNSETSVLASNFAIVGSVEAPDAFTVVFNLVRTHVDFPLVLMDYRARVMPVDGLPGVLTSGMGSGPFKLEKHDVGGISVFVANDEYWDGAPGVAAIEVNYIADLEASLQGLLAGQLDFSDNAGFEQSQWFDGASAFAVTQIPGGNWSGFVMRTDIPPFDNLDLRQAMHLLVNRQDMVDLALSGAGTVSCDSPVMPGDPYVYTDCYSQDVAAAAAKLAESGFDAEIDLYTADICSDWTALTEIFQQQAAAIGLTVNIKTVSSDGFWSEAWMLEPFVMTCWNERGADAALNEIYRGGGSWNESYWAVDAFDALLDAAASQSDFDLRRQNYLDAQQMLHEDGGTIIPYYTNVFRIQKTCVENIPPIGMYWFDWDGITKPADCD